VLVGSGGCVGVGGGWGGGRDVRSQKMQGKKRTHPRPTCTVHKIAQHYLVDLPQIFLKLV